MIHAFKSEISMANSQFRFFEKARKVIMTNVPIGGIKKQSSSTEEDALMDEAKFENKLNELVKEFGNSNPQTQKLADLAKQARESHDQLKKSISNLQEVLDYLRVCIKYQAFDLEATRRENTYLKKILDERNKDQ